MAYERVKQAKTLAVGANQTVKSLQNQIAKSVFVAKDADQNVIQPIADLCQRTETPLVWVDSMKQLGRACKISVGAAAVAIVEE